MGCLNINLCQHTVTLQRIEEEAIDEVTLPESAEFPPETLLTLGKRLQLDDKGCLVRTGTGNEVVTLNLLTALNGRVSSQDAIHLVDDLTGTCHRRSRRHRDSTEQRSRILIRHQTCLSGQHGAGQDCDADDYRQNDGQRLTHQLLNNALILISCCGEGCVKRCMHTVEHRHLTRLPVLVVRLQEDGTQGW